MKKKASEKRLKKLKRQKKSCGEKERDKKEESKKGYNHLKTKAS